MRNIDIVAEADRLETGQTENLITRNRPEDTTEDTPSTPTKSHHNELGWLPGKPNSAASIKRQHQGNGAWKTSSGGKAS